MSIKVYKDSEANSIFIEDANGAQFLNSLQASITDGKILITDLAKNFDIVSNVVHTDFVDVNDVVYPGSDIDVCNELNAIFQTAGTPTNNAPSITSSLTVALTEGETLNYELTADYGVGYEWDLSNVSGVTTVEGNPRKLLGGSSLATGTYNIPVKAINYNGEDSQTIVLTVSTPPFANTKSVKFDNFDYLSGNASLVDASLGRTSNGTGSSDAWTISLWVKPIGTQDNQTLFYFGGNDNNNEGHIWLRYYGSSSFEGVMLEYGTSNNNLRMLTPLQSIPRNQWTHLMVTYDGGTTGSASGSMSAYYSRFKLYVNGVLESTSNTHQNYGYSGSIEDELLQIGRKGAGTGYIRSGGRIDEVAVWDNDQSANISSIYNGGSPSDLSMLSTEPNHWWRTGDGDTYPYLQDSGTSANCIFQMYNMTSADIVSDVP